MPPPCPPVELNLASKFLRGHLNKLWPHFELVLRFRPASARVPVGLAVF